ncbi:MAG: hypothetical protein ACM3NQ_23390 [Bacteroidales bacterium]
MRRSTRLARLALVLFLGSVGTAAAQVTVFEGTFARRVGEPTTTHTTFTAMEGRATITLQNGGVDHSAQQRVSDARIRLNGRTVFGEMQFNQRVTHLETVVDLRDANDLEVFLEGKPGGMVAIGIVWPMRADIDAVSAVWQRLAKLYETSRPSEAELTAWFSGNVAPDFVDDGVHYADQLAAFAAGSGPAVGMTLSSLITGPIDVSGTVYARGYEIRLDFALGDMAGSLVTYMVFDGSRWLWYGDQRWVDAGLTPTMSMTVPWQTDMAASFDTGLGITLWDGNNCSAYRAGARSAIVTGPGLPAQGTKLYHMNPLPYFRLYPFNPMNPAGDWFVRLDDATIQAIPDGAQYTIRLYSEPPETVTLADKPLTTFVKTNPRPPLLRTQLNASLFPTLEAPLTHESSKVNVGGPIVVQWTNPLNAKVGYVGIGLAKYTAEGALFDQVGAEVMPGATSVVLDTTKYDPATPQHPRGWRASSVYLGATDDYERSFGLHWLMYYPWS